MVVGLSQDSHPVGPTRELWDMLATLEPSWDAHTVGPPLFKYPGIPGIWWPTRYYMYIYYYVGGNNSHMGWEYIKDKFHNSKYVLASDGVY